LFVLIIRASFMPSKPWSTHWLDIAVQKKSSLKSL
jgi:hypothetical protein